VLTAAGHGAPRLPASRRSPHPGGQPPRGRGAAASGAGLTTREIGDRLYISPKTADHHIQHVYSKIGVSTRAAAALWAIQHDLIR
jgi:Bacterial regulatory proteins, luxR family